MSISGDRISNKAEVRFSRQDSRYSLTPEEQSISQMRVSVISLDYLYVFSTMC